MIWLRLKLSISNKTAFLTTEFHLIKINSILNIENHISMTNERGIMNPNQIKKTNE